MKQQGNRKRVHAFLSVFPTPGVIVISPTRGTVFHPRMPCLLWMDTVFHPRVARCFTHANAPQGQQRRGFAKP
jgi:hypothetical protein